MHWPEQEFKPSWDFLALRIVAVWLDAAPSDAYYCLFSLKAYHLALRLLFAGASTDCHLVKLQGYQVVPLNWESAESIRLVEAISVTTAAALFIAN